jgi:hypothetical protein
MCRTDITFSHKQNVHVVRVEIMVVGIESRYLAKREDSVHSEPKVKIADLFVA